MGNRLKTFTIDDIRSWGPCYDPLEKLPVGWHGTVLDIINLDNVSVDDKFWVVLREGLLSKKLMRLFAVWCARQVQHLMDDERSLKALDVAEVFANGEATKEQLAAAFDAAFDVVSDAARAAASAAAFDAAFDAARAAARVAAFDVARAAARAAARDAAWDVARAAARAAAWATARAAARATARDAARTIQLNKLKEMIEDEQTEGQSDGES